MHLAFGGLEVDLVVLEDAREPLGDPAANDGCTCTRRLDRVTHDVPGRVGGGTVAPPTRSS